MSQEDVQSSAATIFEYHKFLRYDAADIVAARERAILIHGTKDIDAAGDEVEIAVRQAIRKHLPSMYYVGHGHIVDQNWHASPQFDLIIADGSASPVLFTAQNGADYIPYEAVYAVGEVKSSYYSSKKPIHAFVESLRKTRKHLQRAEWEAYTFFSFMFFVDANDFKYQQVQELYETTQNYELPTIACLLNQGIIANFLMQQELGGRWEAMGFNLEPQFGAVRGTSQQQSWVHYIYDTTDRKYEMNLAALYIMINAFLKQRTVQRPDMFNYLNTLFSQAQNPDVHFKAFAPELDAEE